MGVTGLVRTVTILLLLFNSTTFLYAQRSEIDSLSLLLSQDNLHDTTRIKILNQLSFRYIHLNPTKALDDVRMAIGKAKELEYTKGIAYALNNLGAIHWSQGEYDLALENYLLALEQFKILGSELGMSYCYNNIGEVYKKLGELDKALEHIEKSIEISQRLIGKVTLLSYNNLAEIYFLKGDSIKAIENFAIVISNKESASPKVVAYAYSGMGDLTMESGDLRMARWYFNESEKLRRENDDLRGVATVLRKKGTLYKKMERYDSAEYWLNMAVDLASGIGGNDLLLDTYYELSLLDSMRGNYQSALMHYYQYVSLKDSMFNQQKINQIVRMEAEYNNTLLQKENETHIAKARQQNTFIIGIVMVMLFALAVAGTFYKQQKSQRRINFLLASKNQEINEQKTKIQSQAEKLTILNKKLAEVNENLECEVRQRTRKLLEQNEKLAAYAYTNAHELRAPVANILGLINLLSHSKLSKKESEMVKHLSLSANELDNVIRTIRKNLEDERGQV